MVHLRDMVFAYITVEVCTFTNPIHYKGRGLQDLSPKHHMALKPTLHNQHLYITWYIMLWLPKSAHAAPLQVSLYGLALINHFKNSGLVISISTHGVHSCTFSIERFTLQLTNLTRGTSLEIPPLRTTAMLTTGCWKGYIPLGTYSYRAGLHQVPPLTTTIARSQHSASGTLLPCCFSKQTWGFAFPSRPIYTTFALSWASST